MNKNWRETIFKSCKLKMKTQDNSAFNIYCRSKERISNSCNCEYCPRIKGKGGGK